MKRVLCGLAVAAMAMLPSTASAAPIELFQWVFNVDGTIYDSFGFDGSSSLPASFSGTPAATGAQGSISVTVSGTGAHQVTAFWDYELNQSVNGFSDETGAAFGLPDGRTWELDEPGFGAVPGDIYGHVLTGASALDNLSQAPNGPPDDVSAALGWSFLLGLGQTATVSFLVSESAPAGGFYLKQLDSDLATDLYYSTSIAINGGGGTPVPEPGTILLLSMGLCAAGARRFRVGAH